MVVLTISGGTLRLFADAIARRMRERQMAPGIIRCG